MMDAVLDFLKDIDVILTDKSSSDEQTVPSTAISDALPGDPASRTDRLNQQPLQAPKSQPSLFRKALAFTLCEYLSTATNLSHEDLAMFLGEPDQAGVPAGKAYPEEVTNYQTFLKGDTIQTLDSIAYSLDGDSYFEYLAIYLRNVIDPNDPPALVNARAQLLKAKTVKESAYEHARSIYLAASPNPTLKTLSFVEALNKDQDYLVAWQNEVNCEKAYTKLQTGTMVGLSSQLDQVRSADDRLVERVNNNMPCIAVSDDYIHNNAVMEGGRLEVDPKDIYYRPFYCLPDFSTLCNDWQNLNTDPSTTKRYGPINISLLDARSRSWSELGHPRLDAAQAPSLTASQMKMLEKLNFSITFIGKPAVLDIDRGFWDVPNMRQKLGNVADTLPRALQRKFCKTVKMMFAWSIEISITLMKEDSGHNDSKSVNTNATAATSNSSNVSGLENLNLSFLKLGLIPDQQTPNQIRFVSGSAPYPLLLAVLAKMI